MILFAVLTGFLLAVVAPFAVRVLPRRSAGWVLAGVPLALSGFFISRGGAILSNGAISESIGWADNLGVRLAFRVDGLALLMAVLICGIGTLIFIYAGGYLEQHERLGNFYCLLSLFMASMLGLVTADNLLLLFVFWELTSISSFLLIGFEHQTADARASARQALLITGGGGLALLAGLVMLGATTNSFAISDVLMNGAAVRESAMYVPMLTLILIGAFTKSAQFPFHFWLPGAMAAPTPVSAYLHSATMVKAGIFLLARLSPALNNTPEWIIVVTSIGAITMVVGGVTAFYQTNLKLLLAYSTVSALGLITMLLGFSTVPATQAALTFLLAHAMYKGALFMIAGTVDHETGTKDVLHLGGLRSVMPITFATALVASISLAGFGPVFSFIGKEMMLEAVLESRNPLLTTASFIGATLFALVACVVLVRTFFGELKPTPKPAHEAPLAMWSGAAVLALLSLVCAFVPNLIVAPLISSAVRAVVNRQEPLKLALWHGVNPALLLSAATLATGIGLYFVWDKLRAMTRFVETFINLLSSGLLTFAGRSVEAFARLQTRIVQSGYLRFYIMTIIGTTTLLTFYTLLTRTRVVPTLTGISDIYFYEAGLAALILAAGYAAVRSNHRLRAVASLGIVGIGVGVIFVMFGAPDLALTQFLIETLSVILLVLVLYHLPRFARMTGNPARVRDVVIALSAGALMTTLVLITGDIKFDTRVSNFYAENSYTQAHGRNIVNVILVDFRGLDTLGEITVLAIAAAGVYALLRLRPLSDEEAKREAARLLNTSTRRAELAPSELAADRQIIEAMRTERQ